MLSPGQWHKKIPKGPIENVRWRKRLLERAEGDPAFQRGLWEICKQDILFYINLFAWQINPNKLEDEIGPFITWDFQDEAIRDVLDCVERRKDARWPKSRDMGATWCVLLCQDWLCRFHTNKLCFIMSRDEESVETQRGDPDTLLGKLDFIQDHLPPFLAEGVERVKLRISYTRTHSAIKGGSSTEKAGVGNRYAMMLIDEFGQFDGGKGQAVYERTADTSHCRIFVFTHKDASSMAYDLCYDEKYQSMKEIKTHWTQHPDKNKGLYRYNEITKKIEILDKSYRYAADFSFVYETKPVGGPHPGIRSPWYDNECVRRPARGVAMDLDIDPRGAADQFFDSWTIRQLQNRFGRDPIWVGNLEYDSVTAQPKRLVKRGDGLIKLWFEPKSETEVPAMLYGAGCDPSWGTGATPTCLSMINERGDKVLECVLHGSQWKPDPAARLFVALCRLFKGRSGSGAKLGWEAQGPGRSFGQTVVELGYLNVYFRTQEDVLGSPQRTQLIPGWSSSPKTKLDLLSDYETALRERKCINRSRWSLDETLNFLFTKSSVEYKKKGSGGSPLSEDGIHHGDIVIADALAWLMVKDYVLQPEAEPSIDEINPCTLLYRMKMHEMEREEELVWE